MKTFVLWIVALLLVLALPTAQAFVDPPTFVPVAPNSAQPITVSVRRGVCHAFIGGGVAGIPPMRIEYSPGIVDVIAPGIIAFDGFCNLPIATNPFAIGALAPGDYLIRIWIIDLSFDFQQTTLVANAPLTVTQGPQTQAIPTFGTGAKILLVSLILLAAWRFGSARRRVVLLLAALLGSTTASAQSTDKALLVLLAAGPTAPTPQMLVEPVNFSSGYLGVISPGFTAEDPIRAFYLLQQRATGDFAVWLEANPVDARAKLERYVIVTYPATANLQNALAALAADPNVLYASEPEPVSFATPPGGGTGQPLPHITAKTVVGTPGQAWVNDLHFPGAWALA
ncbi:MAG: hypothetical protein COS34_00470, partial [Lysobacterales bacterium CG02_land_8_20_14_3_00_62_12]